MKHIARFLLLAASLVSLTAFAQWQWLDKDGRKVFSDRAPPANVPEKSILKQPGQAKEAAVQDGQGSSDSAKAAVLAASAAKLSPLDKELAERKKKAEQEEAAKRKTEEEKISLVRADNCQRAKLAQKGLESGMRMARINQQGEREIMDDAARAAETRRIQAIVDANCK